MGDLLHQEGRDRAGNLRALPRDEVVAGTAYTQGVGDDAAKRLVLGRNAKSRVAAEFSIDHMRDKYLALYE